MNAHPPLRIAHGLAVLTLVLTAAAQPPSLRGQERVGCSGRTPAFAVSDDLWLTAACMPACAEFFEPTDSPDVPLPNERDSTDWASTTLPGFHTSHELFNSVDVEGDFLYVAYGAGMSIWDIGGANAGAPVRIEVRDGWYRSACQVSPICGPFLSFPHGGEVDALIEDIDVLAVPQEGGGGDDVYIAVSGKSQGPVGLSMWRFDTSSRVLTAVYQDTSRGARQVRLEKVGTTVYTFTSYDGGLHVYDFSEALSQAPCLEEPGAPVNCPNIALGNLGTISDGRYLDTHQRPTGEILVATTDGNAGSQRLEIWEVSNPASPGSAVPLFDGLDLLTYGVSLFRHDSADYLAVLENNGVTPYPNSLNVIKIFDLENCGGGSCSLGAPVYQHPGVPPRVSDQFLTFSMSGTTPYLYYGLFGALQGPKIEQLLNLSTLGGTNQITEITEGGPTYFDTCQNEDLDYWAWYYTGNDFGFDNYNPRVGKFNGNYFYRAAGGMLDVHVRAGGVPEPTIGVAVTAPVPPAVPWMGTPVTFTATAGGGCAPAVGGWTWTPTTPPDVTVPGPLPTVNPGALTFNCNLTPPARCADASVSVSATNSDGSCDGAAVTPAILTVKDPRIAIESITPGGGTFTQCEVIDFEADLMGQGPTDFAWSIDGEEEETGMVSEDDLSTSMLTFSWDTATARFDEIFADGFESGDTSRWTGVPTRAPARGGTGLPFEIGLALDGGGTSDSVTVELVPLTGDPTFGAPPITATTSDNVTFDFQANTVLGTVSEWSWELEDENGGDLCVFGMDIDVPCTLKSGQNVSHTWVLQTGDRRVDLTISNCLPGSTPQEASTTVMVESLEMLEVTKFELDNGASSAACNIDFGCFSAGVCDCLVNQTITFTVEASGSPDVYDFDWDDNGTFEDTGHPATDPVTEIYAQLFTGIVPRVRARRGSATPAERDMTETLNIVTSLP